MVTRCEQSVFIEILVFWCDIKANNKKRSCTPDENTLLIQQAEHSCNSPWLVWCSLRSLVNLKQYWSSQRTNLILFIYILHTTVTYQCSSTVSTRDSEVKSVSEINSIWNLSSVNCAGAAASGVIIISSLETSLNFRSRKWKNKAKHGLMLNVHLEATICLLVKLKFSDLHTFLF